MSVINQMLRSLDDRQATDKDRAGLKAPLRSLPVEQLARRGALPLLAAGALLGALVAGAAVWWMAPKPAAPPPPPPPVVVPAPPPPAPVPAAIAPAPAPDAARVAAEETLRPPIDLADMKFSLLLAHAPESPGAAEPKPAPAPAAAVAKPPVAAAPPAPKPAAPKPAEAKPAPTAAADAQIDKRTPGGMANEKADAEYRKGMQVVKQGDSAAALPLFQRALELDPMLARARQALLSVLVGARQWSEAQRVAQAGLALDPAQPGWAMILARLQFEQGETAAALDTLTRHAAHAQSNADYHGLFAYLLQKQQRPAEAAEHFRTALSLRPSEGRWWFGLGLALETAGQVAAAREAYLKAREIGNLQSDMAAVVEQKLR